MNDKRTALLAALVVMGGGACGSQALIGVRADAGGGAGGGGADGGGGYEAGGTTGTDGPGACTVQPPSPPPTDPDPVHAAANAAGFALLDQMVGQYVRGDIAVYRGGAGANANVDAFGNIGNLTLETSSARAALSVGAGVAGVTVFSASESERILFQQQAALPGTTFVGTIVPNGTYGGGPLWPVNASNAASCTACAPDLTSAPTSLAWQGLEAIAASGSDAAPLDVTSSVNLQRVSPCALNWDDIFAVSADYAFDLPVEPPAGGEFVRTISGYVDTKAASFRMCDGIRVPYTIDVYINTANLADYGVRNFTASAATTACGGGVASGALRAPVRLIRQRTLRLRPPSSANG
jgi:hypothetical protein